jgi:hypothetical protein
MGSVSWAYFFLPTYYHPWWGSKVFAWMDAMKPGAWLLDDVVSPGYVAMFLALLGLVAAWKGKDPSLRRTWLTVALLGAGTALLCLDPVHDGKVFPLPNAVLYRFYPTFRFFSRFGLLLSLCACLLAAHGFASRTLLWKSRSRWLLFSLILVAAGFELYCPTTPRVMDASHAPRKVYQWLKDLPGDPVIAQYPMTSEQIQYQPAYMFWQIYHGKRMANLDYNDPVNEALRRQISDFRSERTVSLLKKRGVKYMVIHKYHYVADRFPGLNPREGNVRMTLAPRLKGARLVKEWDDAGVYEIEGVR